MRSAQVPNCATERLVVAATGFESPKLLSAAGRSPTGGAGFAGSASRRQSPASPSAARPSRSRGSPQAVPAPAFLPASSLYYASLNRHTCDVPLGRRQPDQAQVLAVEFPALRLKTRLTPAGISSGCTGIASRQYSGRPPREPRAGPHSAPRRERYRRPQSARPFGASGRCFRPGRT
jgi:hypothetical protein